MINLNNSTLYITKNLPWRCFLSVLSMLVPDTAAIVKYRYVYIYIYIDNAQIVRLV